MNDAPSDFKGNSGWRRLDYTERVDVADRQRRDGDGGSWRRLDHAERVDAGDLERGDGDGGRGAQSGECECEECEDGLSLHGACV